MRMLLGLLVLLAPTVFSACGRSTPTTAEFEDMTGKDAATELGTMLKSLADEKKPMPKSAADLAMVEPLFPLSAGQLISGKMIYAWNTPISASTEPAILAHPADAETAGGWVLFQDGTVKKLKADEFAAAKKLTKPVKKK